MARWVLHTSVDDLGSGLIDFVPLVSMAWRAFYGAEISMCFVGTRGREHYENQYGWLIDHISVVEPIKGYRVPAIAKLARMWSATRIYTSLPVMVDDIDWVPLNSEWVAEKFASWEPGALLRVGKEVYKDSTEDAEKIPMGTATADVETWGKVLGRENWDTFTDYCQYECQQHSIDCLGRDNPKHPSNFSDESLLRRSILNCKHKEVSFIDIERGYDPLIDCVDRSAWHYLDIDKLNKNGYIGAHMLRPYRNHVAELAPIVNHIDRAYGVIKQ